MTTARFTLHRFEYIRASTETTLLRLAGHWGQPAGPPTDHALVITSEERAERLTQLPQPPAHGGAIWSAAYSAPLDLVKSQEARFEVELPGWLRVPLPHPRERRIERSAERCPAPQRMPAVDGDRNVEHVWAVLREQIAASLAERAELMERLEREAEARAALAEEIARQRLEAEARRRDADAAREGEREAQLAYELARAEADALAGTAEERRIALKKASRRIGDMRERLTAALAARVNAEEQAREQGERQLENVWAAYNAEHDRRAELERAWRETAEEGETLHERIAALEAANAELLRGVVEGDRRLAQIGELATTLREALAAVRPEPGRFSRDTAALRQAVDEQLERLAALEHDARRFQMAVHTHAGESAETAAG